MTLERFFIVYNKVKGFLGLKKVNFVTFFSKNVGCLRKNQYLCQKKTK